MKRRWRAALLGALALIVVFTVTCYVFYLKRQTAGLLAARRTPEAVARYERIRDAFNLPAGAEESSTQDWQAQLPDGDPDQAELLQPLKEAGALYARLEGDAEFQKVWSALYGDLFVERSVSSWSAAEWERLNVFLTEHADLLAQIRAMAAMSGPLYPLDFSQGYAMTMPHLALTREFARLLQADAITLGRAGDFDGAAANILAGLQLGARLQEEPLLISQLVSTAIDGLMYDSVARAFPEGQISPELTADLARYIHAANSSDSMAEGMRSEHNLGMDFMAQILESGWRQGEDLVDQIYDEHVNGLPWGRYLYASPLGRPWQHLDAQAYGTVMSEFEATLALPYYEARPILDALTREVEDLPATRLFTRTNLPGLFSFHREIARDQARQQLVLLGTALENYASEHGAYPARLEDIQGQANGASLIDPFTGEPFHYTPTANGFELYSVGRNLDDDGGRHDLRDGDIVWRGEEAPKATAAKVAARG